MSSTQTRFAERRTAPPRTTETHTTETRTTETRTTETRRDRRAGSWRSTLAVVICMGCALLALSPLLIGFGWWAATMAMIAVVLGLAAFLRGRGVPELGVVAACIVFWGILIVLLYASTTLWIIFPTFSTLTDISADLAAARQSIAVQEIPAHADGAITQLIVMAVSLLAICSDVLATGLRRPAVSGVAPLLVVGIAPFIQEDTPNVPVYVLTGASLLLVLWCSSRIGSSGRVRTSPSVKGGRNPALALVIAAGAVAAMVVVPTVTPGLTARSLAQADPGSGLASVYATGVDPTIQLGRDLRRNAPVLSLSYTTSASSGQYLKMVDLSDFSSGVWNPEDPDGAVNYTGQPFGQPPGLSSDVPTQAQTTTVSIASLHSDWLPLPYPAQQVDGLSGSWLLTQRTFTLTGVDNTTQGISYQVHGISVQPTADQLAAAGSTVPDGLQNYLSLPDDLPALITQTAQQVTSGAADNYDKAVALQAYFRSSQFHYSLTAPVSGDYDGDNAQMIAAFLQAKEGYCVHFASAMAVMARVLGIPSRIAIGYAPGQLATGTDNGQQVYNVYTDQLHSWPELYFQGIGWLPFEPTPGLAITPPAYSQPDYAATTGSASTDAPSTTSASTAAPDDAHDQDTGAVAADTPLQAAQAQVRGWIIAGGALVLVVLIGLVPFMVRSMRRRRRFQLLQTGDLPATLAWTELEDTLDDFHIHRSRGDTPLDLVQRVLAETRLPSEPAERLRQQVEREQFAAGGSHAEQTRAGIVADLATLIRALSEEASRGERMRARFVPASLWRRRTPASAGALVP
jgi:transglutaminase-like putative cysteine protease